MASMPYSPLEARTVPLRLPRWAVLLAGIVAGMVVMAMQGA